MGYPPSSKQGKSRSPWVPVQGLVQIGDRFLISPYEDEIMCMMIMKKNSKSHDSLKRYLMILVLHSKIGALECRFAGKMKPPTKVYCLWAQYRNFAAQNSNLILNFKASPTGSTSTLWKAPAPSTLSCLSPSPCHVLYFFRVATFQVFWYQSL